MFLLLFIILMKTQTRTFATVSCDRTDPSTCTAAKLWSSLPNTNGQPGCLQWDYSVVDAAEIVLAVEHAVLSLVRCHIRTMTRAN
jgi:hypothetical protein